MLGVVQVMLNITGTLKALGFLRVIAKCMGLGFKGLQGYVGSRV